MAVRELAQEMAVAPTTAHLALIRLQLFGFLREGRKGHFGTVFGPRRSTRWVLTEYAVGDAPLATREYLSVGIQDAEKRYAQREFDLRRKTKTCVPPQGTQKANAYPHGVQVRTPTGDTGRQKPIKSGGLRTPTGDSLETSPWGSEAKFHQPTFAGAPETGRSAPPTPPVSDDAQGKNLPPTSKHEKPLGHPAKRSAAAKPVNGSDALKEKISALEKQRARELKKIARNLGVKIQ